MVLGSCVRVTHPPAPTPTPPVPTNALEAGVRPGPELVGLDAEDVERLWYAFERSCGSLTTREDASGLTRPEDWRAACALRNVRSDAASTNAARHLDLLRRNFELVQVGDGTAFATGYYEPEIRGCRTRQPGCEVPIYRRPPDLLDANPQTNERGRGRVDEQGHYVLYYDRAAIEQGALAGRGLELAWAADPVDLFFLQIQGSGRVRMADGSVMRIGYAGAERPRICRHRPADARPEHPPAADLDAAHRRMDPCQSRRRHGADARECELRLLPGADRAGAARRARPAGDARMSPSPPIHASCRWARRCC